jgi:diacylglycerol kinase family enzyme
MPRRLAAIGSLVALVAGVTLLIWAVGDSFPRGLIALVLVVLAAVLAWQGLVRRGPRRSVAWIAAAALLVGAVGELLANRATVKGLAGLLLLGGSVWLAKHSYAVHSSLSPAAPPTHAVLVYNPKSGGGKATKHHVADEARRRGIQPIELTPDIDIVSVLQKSVVEGADGLMAAGGDGTQALVATVAAQHDLPYACIPAGTRNHFALDLGVDRDDVVGALDAFVSGGEKRVDLGEVNGRVFVNNVSLGVYAEAVQQKSYRDAKIRTILDTVPTMVSNDPANRTTHDLSWTGPDGRTERSAVVILVSNNVYRLGRIIGSGTRPVMDAGVLGIAVIGAEDPTMHRRRVTSVWAQPEFSASTDGAVPAGVDGESLMLTAPLTFRIRPGALRVRIAPGHPGSSPSAGLPDSLLDGIRRLLRVAAGARPEDLGHSADDIR